LKFWPSSRDFNKLVIKAKMHAKTYIFLKIPGSRDFFFVWKYDVIFSLRDLAVCMKTKTFFFKKKFWRKPGILIPDLYFYDVKIQTNIKQNLVEEHAEKSQIFKNIFFFELFLDRAGPGPLILG